MSKRLQIFIILKFHECLKLFNQFNVQGKGLRSLVSGLIKKENDAINYHNAKEIDRSIQEEINFKCFTAATIKSCKKIKTSLLLTKRIVVGNQIIHVDPSILFMRPIVLVARSKSRVNYFAYELTPYPTTLLQDNLTFRMIYLPKV